MTFKEIVGQERVKERLIKSVESGKIAHAQMFEGPAGAGKLALAIAYAQFISCTNRLPNDSCNECPSCLKINKLAHPDLHFSFPVATTKSVSKDPVSDRFLEPWRELLISSPYVDIDMWIDSIGTQNKQLAINTKESEEIIKKLMLKSYESEYKMMIIWHADRINASASNKLLKIIEEPLENTLFLLITEKPDAILPTIHSRTQVVSINAVDDVSVRKYLSSVYSLDDAKARDTTSMAKGNMLDVIRFANEDDENSNTNAFIDWMRLCYGAKVPEIIIWTEQMAGIGRERQKNFFLYCLKIIRESLMMNYEQQLVQLGEKEMGFAKKFSPFIDEINGSKMSKIYFL